MKKFKWLGFIVILVIGVVVVGCKDSNNLIMPAMDIESTSGDMEAGLEKTLPLAYQTSIGNYTFKVYTEKSIDAACLLEGIGANDDAETILSKIDAKRISLYPEEEIMVEVDDSRVASQQENRANIAGSVGVAQQLYWWNLSHSLNYGWRATLSCNVATVHFRVTQGTYDYQWYYGGQWRARGRYYAGHRGWADQISGYQNVKGFRAYGRSASNRIDVVMYFFR